MRLAINRFDPLSDIRQADVERGLGGPVKYVFPSDYRTAIASLNRGEPLVLQRPSRLAESYDEFARDVAGLAARHKDTGKSGLLAILGGRR